MLDQVLSLTAMTMAMSGSKDFVKEKYEIGSWKFMVGNTINIALGASLGDANLLLAQVGLMYYTLPMVQNKKYFKELLIFGLVLLIILGINSNLNFSFNIIEILATTTAWLGAYAMSKGKFKLMGLAWIIADIGFVYIAYKLQLLGLGIQALVFVYHGYLRMTK